MADGTPSSHARRRASARREAEEQPESEPPGPADGEKHQQDRPDKEQMPRRVPGLYGYDPSQWPDASL